MSSQLIFRKHALQRMFQRSISIDDIRFVVSRSKNIITFLNSMVYLLTTRNQELDISGSSDVQKLYETYLVRLTTLLYELNKSVAHMTK